VNLVGVLPVLDGVGHDVALLLVDAERRQELVEQATLAVLRFSRLSSSVIR